jgi:hydrogenase-4 membrane subunit HyfE
VSPLLIALLFVLLVPLFVASWRSSLLGLALQGAIMAMVEYRLDHAPSSLEGWITLIDLAALRAVVAPLALYTVLRARKTPARHDVIPPNLLSWTVALGMVLLSFNVAEILIPETGEQRTLVAVAASGVLLGFLVLATQSGPIAQMIGALRIENAIALLEMGGGEHEPAIGVQLGILGAFIATVVFFRWYLVTLESTEVHRSEASSGAEGPTL